MTRRSLFGIACIAVATLVAAPRALAQTKSAAASAAAASPALVDELSGVLGSSKEQAAGAAGALFGVAKSQMNAGDFSQVAKAVPGMSALLGAAPATGGSKNAIPGISNLGGAAGGLAAAAAAFSKLGLSPDLVSKAIPVLTSFVSKSGGANVGNLLAGVLK